MQKISSMVLVKTEADQLRIFKGDDKIKDLPERCDNKNF